MREIVAGLGVGLLGAAIIHMSVLLFILACLILMLAVV